MGIPYEDGGIVMPNKIPAPVANALREMAAEIQELKSRLAKVEQAKPKPLEHLRRGRPPRAAA